MTLILSGTSGLSDVDGSAATPAIRGTDANTGIFFGADIIGFAEGGAEVARFNADAQFVAAAGTASLPVITTTGDTNTGIFFPAADTIAFAEGGVESMRIDSSGNVGIGTTSPDAKLGVYGGLATTGIVARFQNPVSGGNSKIGFTDTLTYNWTAGTTNNNFTISSGEFGTTAGTERMRIDSSGNLLFDSGYGSVATAYGCRAWVNFNGTGTVAIRGSGNVSSITDNGAGQYTVNFTTAMPDANYSTVITNVAFSATSTQRNSTIAGVFNSAPTTYTTSAVRVATGNPASASLEDNVVMCVSIFR